MPILSTKPLAWLGFGKLAREFGQIRSSSDYQLYAVCRSEKPDYAGFSPTFANVNQPQNYYSLLSKNDLNVVVTLTPESRTDGGYLRGYVTPMESLCGYLQRENIQPKRIVFVSSTSVYGQNDGQWVNEDSLTDPKSFSGTRLREAEDILLTAFPQAVCLRFSGIYGGGRNRLIQQVVSDAESVGESGPDVVVANGYTNRIHQRDCARVIDHLLSLETVQDCYIGTDSYPVDKAEVLQHIADNLRLPLKYSTSKQTSAKRLSNRRLLASGFEFEYQGYKEGYREALVEFASTNEAMLATLKGKFTD